MLVALTISIHNIIDKYTQCHIHTVKANILTTLQRQVAVQTRIIKGPHESMQNLDRSASLILLVLPQFILLKCVHNMCKNIYYSLLTPTPSPPRGLVRFLRFIGDWRRACVVRHPVGLAVQAPAMPQEEDKASEKGVRSKRQPCNPLATNPSLTLDATTMAWPYSKKTIGIPRSMFCKRKSITKRNLNFKSIIKTN